MHKNGRVFLDYKLKKNIAPDDFSYIIDCMRDWAFSKPNVYSMQVLDFPLVILWTCARKLIAAQ